jgi:hypothetical protein
MANAETYTAQLVPLSWMEHRENGGEVIEIVVNDLCCMHCKGKDPKNHPFHTVLKSLLCGCKKDTFHGCALCTESTGGAACGPGLALS